ncbi:MAG: hypothetical protein JXA14_27135, partial [Anaerolineae bacterium]|nr:hypothetical protein [Anaerolineae bacterium]
MKNKEMANKLRWIRKAGVIVVSLFLALGMIPQTVALAQPPPTSDEPQEVEEVEAGASKSEDDSLEAAGLLDAESTANVLVDNRARASTNPSVATDSSGNVYVAYEYAYSGSDHDIYC